MQGELKLQGYDVDMVAINMIDANKQADQQQLIDRTSYPLLQDTDAVKAAEAMKATKDDIYIYDKEGILAVHLGVAGPTEIDMRTPDGYINIKSTLITVHDSKK
ncbi:MAG: hypothetical protein KC503_03755 [Myxococcales bacterium]|nr:hypothetical protein [Myxococcales bacterium]